jgi:hypothetical protein
MAAVDCADYILKEGELFGVIENFGRCRVTRERQAHVSGVERGGGKREQHFFEVSVIKLVYSEKKSTEDTYTEMVSFDR